MSSACQNRRSKRSGRLTIVISGSSPLSTEITKSKLKAWTGWCQGGKRTARAAATDWLGYDRRFDSGFLLGFVDRCHLSSAWVPLFVGVLAIARWGFTWCVFMHISTARRPDQTYLALAFGVSLGSPGVRIDDIMDHLNHHMMPMDDYSEATLGCPEKPNRPCAIAPDYSLRTAVPVRVAGLSFVTKPNRSC